MQVQPQPISYISLSSTFQPRQFSSSGQWSVPIQSKNFERLEIHFSILKTLIFTRETLPITSVESDQFLKRFNQFHHY